MQQRRTQIETAIRVTILFATLLLVGPRADADDPGYGTTLFLPNSTWAADPSAIRVGDTYYLYPTTTMMNVEAWSSIDLINWTYEGVVWEPADPYGWNNAGIWAPDVFVDQGTYYLYYVANGMIGLATSASPTGPFVDYYDHPFIGGGYGSTPDDSIDPHVFRGLDGRLYVLCTATYALSLIRISEMDDPVTVKGDWHIAVVPGLSWEMFWAEGPYMVIHDGTYYLMYSGNNTAWPWYAVGYATATNPLGPYHKARENPILHVDWEYDFWGPGHNSVVFEPDGRWHIFYHTKADLGDNWNRLVRINELSFDANGKMFVVLGDDDTADDDTADDDAIDDDAVDDDAVDDDTADDDTIDDDAVDDDSADDDDVADDDEIDDDDADDDSSVCRC